MTMVSTGEHLLHELSETDLNRVIIVVDGFEPDHLSALEASIVGNLFGCILVTCFAEHPLLSSGWACLSWAADEGIWPG
jgi:hypothetical protein